MINLVCLTKENIKEYNPSLPKIPDHTHGILITRGSGTGKTYALFNLTSQ